MNEVYRKEWDDLVEIYQTLLPEKRGIIGKSYSEYLARLTHPRTISEEVWALRSALSKHGIITEADPAAEYDAIIEAQEAWEEVHG